MIFILDDHDVLKFLTWSLRKKTPVSRNVLVWCTVEYLNIFCKSNHRV